MPVLRRAETTALAVERDYGVGGVYMAVLPRRRESETTVLAVFTWQFCRGGRGELRLRRWRARLVETTPTTALAGE